MQGIKYWRWVMLCIGLWGCWPALTAHADYRITAYNGQVKVDRQGRADLNQRVTYRFDEDYHGVFAKQDLRGIQGGRVLAVTTRLNQGAPKTATQQANGAPNTYQVASSSRQFRVKVFQPVTDGDRLQVTYHFRLRGVVTNYLDTAELNWKVIGAGWPVALNHVRLTLQLPADRVTALQAWTHGPLSGRTQVDRRHGRVIIRVPRVPAKTAVESHLLFPTSVTPRATWVNQKRKVAVQRQEARLAKQANVQRQRQRWLRLGAFWGLVGVTLLVAIRDIGWAKRHPGNRYAHPIPLPHFFEVPPVSPAIAASLITAAAPDTKALTGEILRAASRHQLTLTPQGTKRHQTVQLKRVGELDNSFLAHCFETIAHDDVMTLRDLKTFGDQDAKGRLGKWFHQWQAEINQAVLPYQDTANGALRQNYLTRSLWLTVLLVLTVSLSWLLGLSFRTWVTLIGGLGLGSLWIGVHWRRRRIDRYNAQGLVLVNQIGGFRRMLKDIGHFETAKIGDLILWEAILPYAAAFGLSKRVIAKLKLDFGTEALQAGWGALYLGGGFHGIVNLGDTIQADLAGSLQASGGTSSTTGGAGGFSGGSSGGFGGGSGGGAF